MPEPPQLVAFDVMARRLYLKLLPGDGAPYPRVPSHPVEKTHLGQLYLRSCPFSHSPMLMIIGETRNVDYPVN